MATPKKKTPQQKSSGSKAPPTKAATTAKSPKAVAKSTRLRQDIIIDHVEGEKTGAQSIAPDHSPRGPVKSSAAKVKPGLLLASGEKAGSQAALKEQVEQLLFLQSELLDNKNWQGYLDLFAPDGVYWMPVAPEQTDWQREASIFAEDKLMMEVRMGRVTHPTAWSQAPMWMTNHLVGNIAIESVTPKEVVVRSRFHMMELRRDNVRHFGGTYRHTLVRSKTGLRIKMQRVDMFNAMAPYDYVLQVWV